MQFIHTSRFKSLGRTFLAGGSPIRNLKQQTVADQPANGSPFVTGKRQFPVPSLNKSAR